MARRDGGRSCPCSAGERLAAAPLVHSHADVADSVRDQRVHRNDELDVRASPGFGFENGNERQVGTREFLFAREGDDNVRITDVDSEARARHLEVLRPNERLASVE